MKKGIKRDRKSRKGFDVEKIAKIWKALETVGTWTHIAEISRMTGMNSVTVRYYLDYYMPQAVDQQKFAPTIRLRLVRLKPGMDFARFVHALELIKNIKKR